MQRLYFFAIVAVILSIAACGKSDGRVKVYPVHGKVLVKGTPAEGARVVFYPVAEELKKRGMPVPDATTNSEGVFKVTSFQPNDGAPEGEYTVSITWLEPATQDAHESAAKDRLAGRYSDPQKSQLTAKVEKGGGEIPPFDLQ